MLIIIKSTRMLVQTVGLVPEFARLRLLNRLKKIKRLFSRFFLLNNPVHLHIVFVRRDFFQKLKGETDSRFPARTIP